MSDDDFQLIYQPVPPDGSDDVFASALEDVVATSKVVAIASPYLSFDVLRPLVEGREFRLITDQDACFEAGCDPAFADFLGGNSKHVRTLRGLHAKVVLGAHAGLFGSANLTTTGLCRRFEMASIVRGRRLAELKEWFEAIWNHAAHLDLSTLAQRAPEPAVSAAVSRRAATGLTTTGRLGWLARSPGQGALPDAAGVDEASSSLSGVAESEIEGLAVRLRELTEDRTTARRVLSLLARALEHVGLPVEDERLHLNFGRKNRISVTLGQRHVAWCRRKGEVREFGMMLQSFDVAARAVATIPNSRQDAYTKNKEPIVPELYVPLEALGTLAPPVLSDWERSIRREVQECGKSSYRSKKRESLYHILLDPTLRRAAVRLAHPSAWWFGVNNGTAGHMTLEGVAPLFEGSSLRWPIGNSKTVPPSAYEEMLPGDRVLVWTGHGRDGGWGIIGAAAIERVDDDHVVLSRGIRFDRPLTPYPRRQPVETEAVRFLLRVFGESFKPLGDVRQAVFGVGRTNPITVAKVTDEQVDTVLAHVRDWSTE